MNILPTRKYAPWLQYLISIGMVAIVAVLSFYSAGLLGYRVAALALLMTTSIIAMLFDILPVLIAAILSAVTWNFFFIPPRYTFRISNTEDFLMFLLYFAIATVNAVLTFKIRTEENKARDREEKANSIRLYNTLLNSLSHELRTPITSIIGAVDTLQEQSLRLSDLQKTELLSQIDSASLRLDRQVGNLLNMSRLESGMLQLRPDWCDINELIYSVAQKLETLQHQQQILFEANDHLPLIKVDKGLLEQVIYNILYNALLYTPQDAQVYIEALYEDGNGIIIISDNGPGFPASQIPFGFDKFYRLPNSKPGGSGLGLSIARGFTEAHGGSIQLENRPEGGARFTIRIPAAASFINQLKNE